MDRQDSVSEWLAFGDDDIRVAEHSLLLYPVPQELVCYHCEQAAEKYLKAFLISKDVNPPKTHDLQMLCKLCEGQDSRFAALSTDCADLTKYGVRARYPFEMEIEDSDVKRAIAEAKNVIGMVSNRLDAGSARS
jgi:HEPN domain-containing protein